MLDKFHVSSQIVANISESSFLLFQYFRPCQRKNITRKLLSISLYMLFQILLSQVAFLIFFSIMIFSPNFLLVDLLLQYVALFLLGK